MPGRQSTHEHSHLKVSNASSLEIVDALMEASEDLPKHDSKEFSPAFDALDSMSTSQYAQVIFNDIEDSYPMDLDLTCCYTLTPGLETGHGDRVALYKLPFLQAHEYVAYVWTKIPSTQTMELTFSASLLPKEEDFYQFQYLKGDNSVAGASIPFQLRAPGKKSQKVCGVREEGDLLVVQTPDTAMMEKTADIETKYSALLELSEKISDELNLKTQSFVVLEHEHKSLQATILKQDQLQTDIHKLVGEKLQLEQTLLQSTETLEQSERVLSTTTSQLETVKKTLELKTEELSSVQCELKACQSKCAILSNELKASKEEKDKLAQMLELEIKARENLLSEKQDLVDRMDDTSNMLNAAARSKELAIQEIRTQIEMQDELRRSLASAEQEVQSLDAELAAVKQKLATFTDQESDSFVVASVLSSLGSKLENKEMELVQKNKEIELLQMEASNRNSMECQETSVKDWNDKAEALEKENKCLKNENNTLKNTIENLEKEKTELTKRLEAGAIHYKKLAAEKNRWQKSKETAQADTDKINSLENKIKQLTEELRQSRISQEIQLSEFSPTVSNSRTSSLELENLPSCMSGMSNMDSLKIADAMANSVVNDDRSISSSRKGTEDRKPVLPEPILPENIDPTLSVPELLPRNPAPYSLSTSQDQKQEQIREFVECPFCDEKFPSGDGTVEGHVNKHLECELECPICGKTYNKKDQQLLETHVNTEHFNEMVYI